MNFQIRWHGDFIHVETRLRKTLQRVQRTPLQQLGQRAFQRHLKARVRAKAGEAALIFRMQQRHVHHRITPTQRRIAHQNAKPRITQTLDARGNARIPRYHLIPHLGQAQPLADNAVFDVALENLRHGLTARLHHRGARRHAVAHIQVADDVDRDPRLRAIAQTRIRQRADAALHVTGI